LQSFKVEPARDKIGFETLKPCNFATSKYQGEAVMYTGNLIEELMATVERAEEHARGQNSENDLERWYAAAHSSNQPVQANLLGVA
jgi:hypothetical protein